MQAQYFFKITIYQHHFTLKYQFKTKRNKEQAFCPGRCSSVGWVSSRVPSQGTCPDFGIEPCQQPARGSLWMFCSHIFCFSFSLPLKVNKNIFFKYTFRLNIRLLSNLVLSFLPCAHGAILEPLMYTIYTWNSSIDFLSMG